MADDIMGGSADRGLDISDEALEARGFEADPAQDDTALELENTADEEIDPPVEVEGEVVETATEAAPEAEAVEEPAAPEFTIPEKYAGKTAEEIAKLAVESESYHGQKLDELNKRLQAQEAAAAQYAADMAAWEAAQQEPEPIDVDAALGGMEPVQQYNTAIDLVDQGLAAPNVIENVIKATRDYDPDLAAEMARDFDRRIMRAEHAKHYAALEAKVDQTVQPIQTREFKEVATQASAEFMQGEADAEAYKADIGEIIKQNPAYLGDRSPAAIKAGLTKALVEARGADITRSTAYQQQLRAEKAAAQVEQGGAPKVASLSEVERIRSEVFAAKDPADALFA